MFDLKMSVEFDDWLAALEDRARKAKW